ncbi:MAG: carbamoylphosphate synthase large subunit [Hydrogenophilales bacterium 17-61-9]|nr:MAG: carbamoylphosphate synthase large subunit [Hydrogenophilales bacterium 17-61-9]
MTIAITTITRIFAYNGMELPDIDPGMSPTEVRDVYSAQYADLTTAEVVDHGIENGTQRYEFLKQVGDKG